MNANETAREINLRIPAELKQYRGALDAGLFYLALGASVSDAIPKGNCTSARVKVSGTAENYLEQLKRRFGSQRQVIITALAWVATQDASRRAMLERTII